MALANSLSQIRAPSCPELFGVKNLALLTSPKPILDGTIILQKGKIAALGPSKKILPRWQNKIPIIEGKGFTALPGLINSHSHAAMGFLRDRAYGKKNMIEKFFFPMEKKLSAELVEPLAYSFLYGGLLSGTTCFVDHYYFIEGVANALVRLGLKGLVGETIGDLGGAFPSKKIWSQTQKQIQSWRYGPNILPLVAPHAMDSVSPGLLQQVAKFAREHGLPLHMHLSQTDNERARVWNREKMSPVELAEKCGALSERSLAIHLVSADTKDISILQRSGTTVGLCPASQILYERLAPLQSLLQAKIPLALGTDCSASNDGSDLLAELKLTALLAQDRGMPLSPTALLDMITQTPAQCLMPQVKYGLAVGAVGDLVFLRNDLANLPIADLLVNLVFSISSRQVEHVLVNGKWVLWRRNPTKMSLSEMTESYESAVREIFRRHRLPRHLFPLEMRLN